MPPLLGTVASAIPLASLPNFAGLEGSETIDDLVRMLGLPNAGAASIDDLRNLLKLEAPLAVEGAAPRAGFFALGKFSSMPDAQFPNRALAPTPAEPRFLGLQTHTGRVRFRKIQRKA